MLTLRGSGGNQLLLLSLKRGLLLQLHVKGFCGEVVPKRRGYEGAAIFSVRRRSVEHISKILTLRGSGGNQLLLLSLKRGLLLLPLIFKGFCRKLLPKRRGYEGAALIGVCLRSIEQISEMLTLVEIGCYCYR